MDGAWWWCGAVWRDGAAVPEPDPEPPALALPFRRSGFVGFNRNGYNREVEEARANKEIYSKDFDPKGSLHWTLRGGEVMVRTTEL